MLLERQTQLEHLDGLLMEAARGRGRVAALAGEAGAGKTSLVEAFIERVGEGARILRSACEDLSIPDPLGPLYDLAREAQWALPQAIEISLSVAANPDSKPDIVQQSYANVRKTVGTCIELTAKLPASGCN